MQLKPQMDADKRGWEATTHFSAGSCALPSGSGDCL